MAGALFGGVLTATTLLRGSLMTTMATSAVKRTLRSTLQRDRVEGSPVRLPPRLHEPQPGSPRTEPPSDRHTLPLRLGLPLRGASYRASGRAAIAVSTTPLGIRPPRRKEGSASSGRSTFFRFGVLVGLAWWDHRHVDTVDDQREPNQYKVTLDQLERTVRVPAEDQVIEQPADPMAAGESDWDRERRQLRLAGGA